MILSFKKGSCFYRQGIRLFLTLLLFIFPSGAQLSQQFNVDSFEKMEEIAARSAHVIVVTHELPVRELFKKTTFPKETHFSKSRMTVYHEEIEVYKVIEVMKSPKVKLGNIKVWSAPAFNEESIKTYHEQNISESPYVMSYKAKSRVIAGEGKILFLDDHPDAPDVFILNAVEGMASLAELKKDMLKEKK